MPVNQGGIGGVLRVFGYKGIFHEPEELKCKIFAIMRHQIILEMLSRVCLMPNICCLCSRNSYALARFYQPVVFMAGRGTSTGPFWARTLHIKLFCSLNGKISIDMRKQLIMITVIWMLTVFMGWCKQCYRVLRFLRPWRPSTLPIWYSTDTAQNRSSRFWHCRLAMPTGLKTYWYLKYIFRCKWNYAWEYLCFHPLRKFQCCWKERQVSPVLLIMS